MKSIALSLVVLLSAAGGFSACGAPQRYQIVPVVASGPGAQNSFWTTALWIADAGTGVGTNTLTLFTADGQNGGAYYEKVYSVAAGGTLEIPDVITDLGLPQSRTFWLYVMASDPVTVNARIYTTDPVGGGTYGQHIPVSYEDQGIARGDIVAFPVPLDISRFRVNVGFTYGNALTTRLSVKVLRGDGTVASDQVVTLHSTESIQFGPVNAGMTGAAAGQIIIEALDDTGEDVYPYVSVADMISNDPVFLFHHTPCAP